MTRDKFVKRHNVINDETKGNESNGTTIALDSHVTYKSRNSILISKVRSYDGVA